jgi:uncharacterized OsmC-like protein
MPKKFKTQLVPFKSAKEKRAYEKANNRYCLMKAILDLEVNLSILKTEIKRYDTRTTRYL